MRPHTEAWVREDTARAAAFPSRSPNATTPTAPPRAPVPAPIRRAKASPSRSIIIRGSPPPHGAPAAREAVAGFRAAGYTSLSSVMAYSDASRLAGDAAEPVNGASAPPTSRAAFAVNWKTETSISCHRSGRWSRAGEIDGSLCPCRRPLVQLRLPVAGRPVSVRTGCSPRPRSRRPE